MRRVAHGQACAGRVEELRKNMGFIGARPVPVKLRMAWRARGMTRGQARVGVRSLSCAGRGPTVFACLPKKIMPPNSPFAPPRSLRPSPNTPARLESKTVYLPFFLHV